MSFYIKKNYPYILNQKKEDETTDKIIETTKEENISDLENVKIEIENLKKYFDNEIKNHTIEITNLISKVSNDLLTQLNELKSNNCCISNIDNANIETDINMENLKTVEKNIEFIIDNINNIHSC